MDTGQKKENVSDMSLCPIQIKEEDNMVSKHTLIPFKMQFNLEAHQLLDALYEALPFTTRNDVYGWRILYGKIEDGDVMAGQIYAESTKFYAEVRTKGVLYIAVDGNHFAVGSDDEKLFEQKLRFMATNIVLYHNKIESTNDENEQKSKELYTEALNVNIKMKVSELKTQISKKYKIPLDELIFRKAYHGEALKQSDRTLKSYGIHRNKVLFIERGKQKDSEFIFQIFIQNEMRQRYVLSGWTRENIKIRQIIPDTIFNLIFEYFYQQMADEPLTFVGNVILDRNWSMDKVKKVISKKCAGKLPKIKRMRIREFVNSRLTRLYFDDRTLGKNCGSSIRDYKQICVQRKWRDEEAATRKHILLSCVKYYPKTKTFGPLIEFMFSKKIVRNSKNLKRELCEISGIESGYLQCGHVLAHHLKSYAMTGLPRGWRSHANFRQGDIILYFEDGTE